MEKPKLENGEFVSDMAIPMDDLRGYIRKYHEAGMKADEILNNLQRLRVSAGAGQSQKSSESAVKNISIPEKDIKEWAAAFLEAGFSEDDVNFAFAKINADSYEKEKIRKNIIEIPIKGEKEEAVEVPVTIVK